MPDEILPGAEPDPERAINDVPSPEPPARTDAESTTASGYAYTVVDDENVETPAGASGVPARRAARRGSAMLPWLIAAAIVPAIIVGVAVWFIASSRGGSGDKGRVSADVANLLNVFSQASDGSVSTRYEAKLPPGFPDGIPAYPGGTIVSSVTQPRGADQSYLVVYDATDSRAKVSAYFADQLKNDPWQIVAAQDGRESTLQQFSRIDDPNISGLVLISESAGGKLTTIVQNVQVAGGAKDAPKIAFAAIAARTLPEGYPESDVPAYNDALLIESAFQKQGSATSYIASYITKGAASDVLDFYRGKFKDGGLSVQTGDASGSTLVDAEAVQFSNDSKNITGQIVVGKFAQDDTYTRIDVQTRAAKK